MKEDLKYGEKYRLELLCKSQTKNIIVFETPTGGLLPLGVNDLECVSPVHERENTESVHKYNPCRKFRKGDKVRLVEWQGRLPFDCENYETETAGQLCIVAEDEDAENAYMLHVWKLENMESEPNDDERVWHAFPLCSIELVTPVEELEPYIMVELCNGGYAVYKDSEKEDNEVCIFWNDAHPHAKAAAEAERDRLNEEYRKEKQ